EGGPDKAHLLLAGHEGAGQQSSEEPKNDPNTQAHGPSPSHRLLAGDCVAPEHLVSIERPGTLPSAVAVDQVVFIVPLLFCAELITRGCGVLAFERLWLPSGCRVGGHLWVLMPRTFSVLSTSCGPPLTLPEGAVKSAAPGSGSAW